MLILSLALMLFGCNNQNDSQENLKVCVDNWALYPKKINAVRELLDKESFKEVIVVKQGIDTEKQYWFMLIGLNESKGTIAYMSDSIKQPVKEVIDYDSAHKLIKKGKSLLENKTTYKGNMDVSHVQCHFMKYKKGDFEDEFAISGFIIDIKPLASYIDYLNLISFKFEEEVEKDTSIPSENANKSSEEYKLRMKNNYFIELD